jgi:hypothetical protein
VSSVAGEALRIDGYPWRRPFAGHYFNGQTLRVEASDRSAAEPVLWTVDGRPLSTPGPRLELIVTRPTVVSLATPGAAR